MSAGQTDSVSNAADPLTEEQVRDYLQRNSDFLERNPELLNDMQISHSSGSAVSLVEKQVSVLRDRNVEMRRRLNTLTANARDNDRLYDQTRRLILALMDAPDLNQLSKAFSASMKDDFGVEYSSLIVFGDDSEASEHCRIEPAERARIEIGGLLKGGKSSCGVLRKEELSYLFAGTGEIGSAAVMPLDDGIERGVIAVGSSDASHYTAAMGTVFLSHVGDVLVRLMPHLQVARSED